MIQSRTTDGSRINQHQRKNAAIGILGMRIDRSSWFPDAAPDTIAINGRGELSFGEIIAVGVRPNANQFYKGGRSRPAFSPTSGVGCSRSSLGGIPIVLRTYAISTKDGKSRIAIAGFPPLSNHCALSTVGGGRAGLPFFVEGATRSIDWVTIGCASSSLGLIAHSGCADRSLHFDGPSGLISSFSYWRVGQSLVGGGGLEPFPHACSLPLSDRLLGDQPSGQFRARAVS